MKNKISLVFVGALLFGCASYTKIDGKKWDGFDATHKEWRIDYRLPHGYIADDGPKLENHSRIGKYHYDVLKGAGVYGDPWGETQISMFVRLNAEADIDLHTQARLKEDWKGCSIEDDIQWRKITCESAAERYWTRFSVMQLYPGEYLYVITRILYRAYERKNVMENRRKMFQDIIRSITVTRISVDQ